MMRFYNNQKLSIAKLTEVIPWPVLLLFLIDIMLSSAYLLTFIVDTPFVKIKDLLNLDSETGIATWYSSIKLFNMAGFVGLVTYRYVNWKDYQSWALIIISVLFLFMSMDEIVEIHEWLGRKTDIFLPGGDRGISFYQETGIWMFVIGIPFFICFLILAFCAIKYLSINKKGFKKIIYGMIIFLTGALGFFSFSFPFIIR